MWSQDLMYRTLVVSCISIYLMLMWGQAITVTPVLICANTSTYILFLSLIWQFCRHDLLWKPISRALKTSYLIVQHTFLRLYINIVMTFDNIWHDNYNCIDTLVWQHYFFYLRYSIITDSEWEKSLMYDMC